MPFDPWLKPDVQSLNPYCVWAEETTFHQIHTMWTFITYSMSFQFYMPSLLPMLSRLILAIHIPWTPSLLFLQPCLFILYKYEKIQCIFSFHYSLIQFHYLLLSSFPLSSLIVNLDLAHPPSCLFVTLSPIIITFSVKPSHFNLITKDTSSNWNVQTFQPWITVNLLYLTGAALYYNNLKKKAKKDKNDTILNSKKKRPEACLPLVEKGR